MTQLSHSETISLNYLSPADYVKLIELDLFELCVRMLVKPHSKMPMLEIDANNNMLHIR